VPNDTGCRPVDRVAASLICWIGGGVQPANRSKTGMFCAAAPIWRFKTLLGAVEAPERARASVSGLFLIEVFPALALAAMSGRFCARSAAPRYNPRLGRRFRQEDWLAVVETARDFGRAYRIRGLDAWARRQQLLAAPRKADQDRLDAVLCALVAVHWLMADRAGSILIGDLVNGYMVAPASAEVRARLTSAALRTGVAID
jgi:predicted RNase H-like nuclease